METEEFRAKIKRQAIRMKIGGFRPTGESDASWFGKVNKCVDGESWPYEAASPMIPLCQIDLTELPFKPQGLEDIEFLTVFISSKSLPDGTPNGSGWCLRAYKKKEELVDIEQPEIDSHIKPFEMMPEIIEEDYPCWEDVEDCPEEIEDDYFEIFDNQNGLKLGGWPSLIQSEIFWAPWNKHPIEPKYVFQIDSTEKGNWAWGDGGVGYFGRGTTEEGNDEWALSWQCL